MPKINFTQHVKISPFFFNLNIKLVNVVLSTLSSIMEEKMNNHNIKVINKINYYHMNSEGMKNVYEIVDFIHRIKKDNTLINLCETEEPNHSDVSYFFVKII